MNGENVLSRSGHVLLVRAVPEPLASDVQALAAEFFGTVHREPVSAADLSGKRVYACGDLTDLSLPGASVVAIRGLATNVPAGISEVTPGQVPRDVHGLGVLFPRFFEEDDLFERIVSEHTFQHLTESNKPSVALRRGIYLTDVAAREDGLHFRLMRCSSNLTGPTDNLRTTDRAILAALNREATRLFTAPVDLNHVLAQIYDNHRSEGNKQKKARISAHSDKTKDMPPEAVMAFCSFYASDELGGLSIPAANPFDRVYKKRSGLARLFLKRKSTVDDPDLVESVSIALYPGSVFFMPLSTNRLYTHAIRPSALDVEQVPTRMGYVVRCSSRDAVYRDGETWLDQDGELRPLRRRHAEGVADLRAVYREENFTDASIRYQPFPFSMNDGDYQRPLE